MEIDWGRLRSFRTSKEEAFEELCCQLAEDENPDGSVSFVRKGTPDAGIECYWTLADGSEVGWQAKFHREALDDSQWSGLDKSFKTALAKHPALTKFIICLPRNLSDSRNNKTEQDRFDERVKKWKRLAGDAGRVMTVELWNESQLTKRLSKPENRGTVWFWFDTPSFTDQWFEHHVRDATSNANAQDRYDKELHLDNSEDVFFDALSRNGNFWNTIAECFQELASEESMFCRSIVEFKDLADFKSFASSVETLFHRMRTVLAVNDDLPTDRTAKQIPLNHIESELDEIEERLASLHAFIGEVLEKRNLDSPDGRHQGKSEAHRNFDYRHWKLSQAIQSFSFFLKSKSTQAANSLGLLIVGEAGQGKTHTFCNWSEKSVKSKTPTVLLFGENFDNRNPWVQMIELTGLKCDVEQFVGGLVAAARCNRRPAMILIDAINDGVGKRIWKSNLAGMLSRIGSSKWVRVAISVRTTYRDFILPQQGLDDLTEIRHRGFSGQGRKAITKFFSAFGIQPSRPPLTREFDNPLFLKLFCKGMEANQLETVPRGINGITAISNFFLSGVNKKLAEQLGFDCRSKLVQRAVDDLASEMAATAADRIDYERAKEIVNRLHVGENFENTLFRHLEHEAILTTVPRVADDEKYDELIEDSRFTFQRFSDHFIANHMLKDQLEDISRNKEITDESSLGQLLTDLGWHGNGILDAIAVQLPELSGVELFELKLPKVAGNASVIRSVQMSLPWRSSTSFTPQLFEFLEAKVINSKYEDLRDQFWETVLSLTTMPDHPLNAIWLNARLTKQDMPERDAWWSTFLHLQASYHSAAIELIEWAWFESEQYQYSDEACELAALALCWMFTAPNRRIRDSATKSVVSLCRNRPAVLEKTFERLKDVDDPYLAERLMAVVCGCALLTNDDVLSRLAKIAFDHVFSNGKPVPSVLLRDYARLTIEKAVDRRVFEVDLKKIRPPYGSSWPEIPTEEEVGKRVAGPIVEHVTGWYGHFAKDVAKLDHFSAVRIGERPPSPTELLEKFEDSLTDRQWQKFARACDARSDGVENFQEQLTRFGNCLKKGSKKRLAFDSNIREILEDPSKRIRQVPIPRMDNQLVKRWLQVRAMTLGWSAKLFHEFDDSLDRNHDARAKGESVGLKYCWIALRELQARAADNFEMDWATEEGSFVFDGPWRIIYGRDIDPTNIVPKTPDRLEVRRSEAWWVPVFVSDWNEQVSDDDWAKLDSDIPDAKQLLSVSDESDRQWLVARSLYDWSSPTPPGEQRYETVTRQITCSINSYLIKKSDVGIWKKWFEEDIRRIEAMPINREWSSIFNGEFCWAPIYNSYALGSSVGKVWSNEDDIDAAFPCDFLNTSFEYYWEGSSDFSIDGVVRFHLPSKIIAEEMGLHSRYPGIWCNNAGQTSVFDPAVSHEGPNALLFDRELLTSYLDRHGLCMFWTYVPERRLIGGSHYNGHIDAHGLYWLEGGVLDGELITEFVPKGYQ